MILLKRNIITPVEEKSLMIISNGILLTDKILLTKHVAG